MGDKYLNFKPGKSLNEQLMVPPDITITAVPMTSPSPSSSPSPQPPNMKLVDNQSPTQLAEIFTTPVPKKSQSPNNENDTCKYAQLLAVIEDMGKDIQPSYAGSRTSAERLKRSIVHARILVRECLMEAERSARQ
uniref:Cyclin-dependent kinase 2-associated protein 2 n=1 Tax=Cacopsylla melanoneura TaxID=428564 RepID=A0A8D8W3W8_9HEMI